METFQTVFYDKTIECRQQYGSHLVKIQRVRINIVKCPFLALDRFLQVAHSLRILDPNRKDTLCRFAKDPAIELKGSRHDDCKHGHVITRDEPNQHSLQGPSRWRKAKFMVGDLKKRIQEERKNGSLAGVDAHTLVLWKVRAIEESQCQAICMACSPSFQPKEGIPG